MMSLSGSCISLKVSLTVIKKGVLVLPSHYRVSRVRYTKEQRNNGRIQDTRNNTHYKEPGQDGYFDDCTKDVLEELCEDEYSDAEEELEANLDTD